MTPPVSVAPSIEKYGAMIVILSVVVGLLATYFWKLMQKPSLFERLFDAQNKMLEHLASKLEKIKEDIIEIRTALKGEFRVRGRDDD